MTATAQRTITSGQFTLDGGSWDVDNNVWLLGDDREVVIIDAAHDADKIVAAVGDRKVKAIVCTHAHNDHVNAAPTVADRISAGQGEPVPIMLHPDDLPLWDMTHPSRRPDHQLSDGEVLSVAGTSVTVLHTPGHAPGAVCLWVPSEGVVFTGDTLFQGGPGATGRSFSDYDTIIASITQRLLTLPGETVVHTGHGDGTTIGAEAENLSN